jgi:RimJ/RimL family protein N-acetyltransferase
MCPYCSRVQPKTVRTERLELVWLSPEQIETVVNGRPDVDFAIPHDWPDDHDRRFLNFRLRQLAEDPSRAPWVVRAVVLRDEKRSMIGHVGFHGPPGVNARKEAQAVEIGYTIFPDYRRQGYATEAVRGLLGWAKEQGVHHYIASIGPDNEPSLALVRRLGFREVGRHWDDEDGEELEFELVSDSS